MKHTMKPTTKWTYDWQLNVSTGDYSVSIDDGIQLFRMAGKPPYLYWARCYSAGWQKMKVEPFRYGPVESTPKKAIATLRRMMQAGFTGMDDDSIGGEV